MAKQVLLGVLFVIVGITIDGIQFFVELIMTAIGLMSGTVGGCAAGAAVAGSVGCAVGGFFGSFADPFLAVGAVPFAAGMGMVLSVIVTIMFGIPLLFLMWLKNYLYSIRATFTFISEIIPGFGLFPGWSVFTITSVMRKMGESVAGSVVSSVQGTLNTLSTGSSTATTNNKAANDNFAAANDNSGDEESFTPQEQAAGQTPANKNERTPIRLVR